MKSIIISIAILLTGCASSFSHGGLGNTGVAVNDNNYKILGKAEGRASVPRLLGLELSSGEVYNAAMDDLRLNASSQYGDFYTNDHAFMNLTVDMQYKVFILLPIFNQQVVRVSADVIEFNPRD